MENNTLSRKNKSLRNVIIIFCILLIGFIFLMRQIINGNSGENPNKDGNADQLFSKSTSSQTSDTHNGMYKLSTLGGLLIGKQLEDVVSLIGKPEYLTQGGANNEEGYFEAFYINKAVNDVDNKVCSFRLYFKGVHQDVSRVVSIDPMKQGERYGFIPDGHIIPPSPDDLNNSSSTEIVSDVFKHEFRPVGEKFAYIPIGANRNSPPVTIVLYNAKGAMRPSMEILFKEGEEPFTINDVCESDYDWCIRDAKNNNVGSLTITFNRGGQKAKVDLKEFTNSKETNFYLDQLRGIYQAY